MATDGGAFKHWEPLITAGRCAGHQEGVSNYVEHRLFLLGFIPYSLSVLFITILLLHHHHHHHYYQLYFNSLIAIDPWV